MTIRYRYTLHRDGWLSGVGRLCWVMLNPSTADDTVDDPTIRRVVRFTRDHGYAELEVVNLYAARATQPRDLWAYDDPVGPGNRRAILDAFERASDVVFAWGASGGRRAAAHGCFVSVWAGQASLAPWCLGRTASGAPRHPLYVPADTPLERWRPPRNAVTAEFYSALAYSDRGTSSRWRGGGEFG